jgi:hypothetical protein
MRWWKLWFDIPGKGYDVESTGSAGREVRCEQCGFEYFYVLSRKGWGQGFSPYFLNNQGARARARVQAEDTLARKLAKGIDAVPCPRCGWYQATMVAKLKRLRLAWMKTVAWVTALPAVFCLFAAVSETVSPGPASTPRTTLLCSLLAGLFTAGTLLPLVRYFLVRDYEPNAEDVETRKANGQARAISREDYRRLQQEQGTNVMEDRGRP